MSKAKPVGLIDECRGYSYRRERSSDTWPNEIKQAIDEVLHAKIGGEHCQGFQPTILGRKVLAKLRQAGITICEHTAIRYITEREEELRNGKAPG